MIALLHGDPAEMFGVTSIRRKWMMNASWVKYLKYLHTQQPVE